MRKEILLSPIENREFLDIRMGLRTKKGTEVIEEMTQTRFLEGKGEISEWRGLYNIRGATVEMKYYAHLGSQPGRIVAQMYGESHSLEEAQGTLLYFVGQKKLVKTQEAQTNGR